MTIAAGTTLDASAATTLTTVNAQNWNGNFSFGGSFALNTGTGAVTLGAATLQLTNLGAGLLTVGGTVGGTSDLTFTANGAGGFTLSGAMNSTGTITNNGAGAGITTLGGIIAGTVGVITQNSATSALTLTGNNAGFGGGVTILNGTVNATTSANALGTGNVLLGDTGSTATNTTLAGGIAGIPNAITVRFGNSGTATITNTAANSSFTGLITLQKDLTISATAALTQGISGGVSGSGNLTIASTVGSTGAMTLGTGGLNYTGTLTNNNAGTGTVTVSGALGGAVGLVTQNSATSIMVVNGSNSNFDGDFKITAGFLYAGNIALALGLNNTITLGDVSTPSTGAGLNMQNTHTYGTTTSIVTVANGNGGPLYVGAGTSGSPTLPGGIVMNSPLTIASPTWSTGTLTVTGNVTQGTGTNNDLTITYSTPGINSGTSSKVVFSGGVNNSGNITITPTSTGATTTAATFTGAIGGNVGTVTLNRGPAQASNPTVALNNADNAFGNLFVNAGTASTTAGGTAFGTGTITLGPSTTGLGTVTLSTTNVGANYVNPLIVSAGSTGTVLIQGTGSQTFSGAVTLNNALSLQQLTAGSVTAFTSTITGSSAITIPSTNLGIVSLTGANGSSFTGPVTINGGTLSFGSGSLGNGSALITFAGGALQWAAGANTQDVSSRFAPGGVVNVDVNNNDITFGTAIDNTHSGFTFASTTAGGVLHLNLANTYTGTTTVAGGTLSLENAAAVPSATSWVFAGGTLQATVAQPTFTGPVSLTGSPTFAGAQSFTFNNATTLSTAARAITNSLTGGASLTLGSVSGGFVLSVTGTGAVNANVTNILGDITGAGTGLTNTLGLLNLSGANDYGAATTITSGTVVAQGAGTLSVNTSNIALTGTLKILNDGSGTITTNAGNNFTVANNQATSTIFVGNNNTANGGNSSGTTLNSTIQLGNLTTFAGNNGATLNIQGANGYRLQIGNVTLPTQTTSPQNWILNPTTAPITIAGAIQPVNGQLSTTGTMFLVLGGTATGNVISSFISNAADAVSNGGANAFAKAVNVTANGSGSWTLNGVNTYTGATTVTGGTLNISATGSINSTASVAISGGTLALLGNNTFSVGTTVSGTGALQLAAADSLQNSPLTLLTGATLQLRNENNTTFTLGGGIATLPAAASTITFDVNRPTGGSGTNKTLTLNPSAGSLTYNNVNVTSTINVTGGNGYTLALPALSGPASLNVNVAANTNLSLATYTGSTANAGTLTIGGAGNTTIGTVANGGANVLSLAVNTTGTATLTNNATYTGTTTLNNGTLALNAAAAGSSTDLLLSSTSLTLSGGALSIFGTPGQSITQSLAGLTTTASTSSQIVLTGPTGGSARLIILGTTALNGSLSLVLNIDTTVAGNQGEMNTGFYISGGFTEGQLLSNVTVTDMFGTGIGQVKAVTGVTGAGFEIIRFSFPTNPLTPTSDGIGLDGTNNFGVANNGTLSNFPGTISLAAGTHTINSLLVDTTSDGAGQIGTLDLNGQTLGVATLGVTTGNGNNYTVSGSGQLGTTAAALNVNIAGNGQLIIDSKIGSGTSSLVVSGSGTMQLNGAQAYTGATTINSGTVLLGATALTTSGFTIGDGNLTMNSSNGIFTRAITFGSGSSGTFNLNGFNVTPGALTTNATVAGTPIVQNGSSSTPVTLTLGTTGIYAGIIRDGGTAALGLQVTAGTVTLGSAGGNNTYTGGTTVTGGILVASLAGTVPTGAVSITTGQLTASVLNSVLGTVTVNSGTLLVSATGAINNGSSTITYAGSGTLQSASSYTMANPISLSSGVTLTNNQTGGTTTFTGVVTGGSNTTINLQQNATNSAAIYTTGADFTNFFGTIQYTAPNAPTQARNTWSGTIGATLVNAKFSLGGPAYGAGTSTSATPSIMTIATTNAGGFQMGSLSSTGTKGTHGGVINVTATGGLVVGSLNTGTTSSPTDYYGVLRGTGAFTKVGTGAMQLSGDNTYSGTTTVSAGTLIAGAASPSTSVAAISATFVISSPTITLASQSLVDGNLVYLLGTLNPTGFTLATPYYVVNTPTASTSFQLSATPGGPVITPTGAGTAVTVSVPGAFGSANSPIVLGDAATTTNNSSPALLTGGAFTIGRAITIANQATGGTYAIGGNTDNNSTFSGLVTINQPLTVSQVATTGANALSITGGITGGNAGSKNVTFSGAGAINVSTTAISDGGGMLALIKTGSGTTTLTAANSFSGTVQIQSGILAFDNLASGAAAQALGRNTSAAAVTLGVAGASSGTLNYVGAGGTLDKNIHALGNGLDTIQNGGSGLLTLSGTITNGTVLTLNGGASGINVTGAIVESSSGSDLAISGGELTLSGASTYSGATNVNGGTLTLASTASLGNTAITVANGATFAVQAGQRFGGDRRRVGEPDVEHRFVVRHDRQRDRHVELGRRLDDRPAATSSLSFEIGNLATGLDKIAALTGAASMLGGGAISIRRSRGNTALTAGSYDLITATGGGLTGGFSLARRRSP